MCVFISLYFTFIIEDYFSRHGLLCKQAFLVFGCYQYYKDVTPLFYFSIVSNEKSGVILIFVLPRNGIFFSLSLVFKIWLWCSLFMWFFLGSPILSSFCFFNVEDNSFHQIWKFLFFHYIFCTLLSPHLKENPKTWCYAVVQ